MGYSQRLADPSALASVEVPRGDPSGGASVRGDRLGIPTEAIPAGERDSGAIGKEQEKEMSVPTSDNAFLDDLELTVSAELAQAENGQPEEAACVPIDQWLTDPADDQRYEVGLRSLFGAVEALEDGKTAGW